MNTHKKRRSSDLFVRNKETGRLERDKSLNTPYFNKKAKDRREKAKHDDKSKKINQRVARRKRK